MPRRRRGPSISQGRRWKFQRAPALRKGGGRGCPVIPSQHRDLAPDILNWPAARSGNAPTDARGGLEMNSRLGFPLSCLPHGDYSASGFSSRIGRSRILWREQTVELRPLSLPERNLSCPIHTEGLPAIHICKAGWRLVRRSASGRFRAAIRLANPGIDMD